VVQDALSGCYVSSEFPTFTPLPAKVESRWLHWLTKTNAFWDQCDEKSRGTSGKNRIRPEQFLGVVVPLPPIEEQQRIVNWIESMSPQIAELKTQQKRRMVEVEALEYRSFSDAITATDGGEKRLHEVCEAIIDNLHSNPVYSESGVPCVRSPDVGWGTLMLETALRTDDAEYTRRTVRGEPKADDIVLVREGGGTGKAALVAPGQRFSLGQRVMMLRPDKTKIVPEFFLFQLLSPLVQEEQMEPVTKGSASPHLNIGALQQFRIIVPCLTTQEGVVQHLRQIRGKIADVRSLHGTASQKVDALLPSILNQAFNGKV
jgi:type I restriction enzyme S subunit